MLLLKSAAVSEVLSSSVNTGLPGLLNDRLCSGEPSYKQIVLISVIAFKCKYPPA